MDLSATAAEVTTPAPVTATDRDRACLRGGFLNVHLIVIGISLLMTVVVWRFAEWHMQARVDDNFDRAADQVISMIEERMNRYEDSLWAGVALINAGKGEVDLETWRRFSDTLQIDVNFPGVRGLGLIRNIPRRALPDLLKKERQSRPDFEIHPSHMRDTLYPIVYIEPQTHNQNAVGLDMSFESNRLHGLTRAGRTGTAQISGPITLVQDETGSRGFLFFAPFYTSEKSSNVAQRRFAGAVYAPFVVRDLMDGIFANARRFTKIRISDGGTQIYDEVRNNGKETSSRKPMQSRIRDLNFYGRTWQVEIATNSAFESAHPDTQPKSILLGSLLIDICLLALFLLLTTSNRRAIQYADHVSTQLRAEKRELQTTNTALQQFTYAASHDLKTPIRAIRDVTTYLGEDLRERFPQSDVDPDISAHFATLRQLVDRMDALVKGVFECAQIGQKPLTIQVLNCRKELHILLEKNRIQETQVVWLGDFPELRFARERFVQIFGNLIRNAHAHHPDSSALTLVLTGTVKGHEWQLSVADNGTGIPERYHKKIFELFQSLARSGSHAPTGLGLTIARRAVEDSGGRIAIETGMDGGAVFTVNLPKTVVMGFNSEKGFIR